MTDISVVGGALGIGVVPVVVAGVCICVVSELVFGSEVLVLVGTTSAAAADADAEAAVASSASGATTAF